MTPAVAAAATENVAAVVPVVAALCVACLRDACCPTIPAVKTRTQQLPQPQQVQYHAQYLLLSAGTSVLVSTAAAAAATVSWQHCRYCMDCRYCNTAVRCSFKQSPPCVRKQCQHANEVSSQDITTCKRNQNAARGGLRDDDTQLSTKSKSKHPQRLHGLTHAIGLSGQLRVFPEAFSVCAWKSSKHGVVLTTEFRS